MNFHLSLLTVALACFCFFACTQENVDVDQPLVGIWQLQRVIERDSIIERPNPYTARKDVQVEFRADGMIKGSSSSNNIAGTYKITGNDSISISIGYESKLGENPWGQYFAKGVIKVTTFEIEKDILKLDYSGNKLVFKKIN